jgi:hypothetical protein
VGYEHFLGTSRRLLVVLSDTGDCDHARLTAANLGFTFTEACWRTWLPVEDAEATIRLGIRDATCSCCPWARLGRRVCAARSEFDFVRRAVNFYSFTVSYSEPRMSLAEGEDQVSPERTGPVARRPLVLVTVFLDHGQ